MLFEILEHFIIDTFLIKIIEFGKIGSIQTLFYCAGKPDIKNSVSK